MRQITEMFQWTKYLSKIDWSVSAEKTQLQKHPVAPWVSLESFVSAYTCEGKEVTIADLLLHVQVDHMSFYKLSCMWL